MKQEEYERNIKFNSMMEKQKSLIQLPVDIREFITKDYRTIKEWKKLLLKYHPDKHPGEIPLYTEYTQQITGARPP